MEIKYHRIDHQFSLFSFNEMKPVTKIPIKRISKERLEQAKKEMRAGDNKNILGVLRDINDALERYEQRIK